MSASYPGSVKVFAARSNGQTIDASHVQDLQDEVSAIETGLLAGTGPFNSSRLTAVQLQVSGPSTLANLQVTGNSTFASTITFGTNTFIFSTAVPGSTGQVLMAQGISGSTVTVGWGSVSSPVAVIKAQGVVQFNAPAVFSASVNCASVSSNGVGDVTVTFTNAMTSSNYTLLCFQETGAASYPPTTTAKASGSFRVVTRDGGGTAADKTFSFLVSQ